MNKEWKVKPKPLKKPSYHKYIPGLPVSHKKREKERRLSSPKPTHNRTKTELNDSTRPKRK
jgi:hypothetical protein